jgi:hypothetical protein
MIPPVYSPKGTVSSTGIDETVELIGASVLVVISNPTAPSASVTPSTTPAMMSVRVMTETLPYAEPGV